MTKIEWAKWSAIAEILSAIAIVVTLLYLASQTQYLADQTGSLRVQTQQNNVLLESQARAERESVRRTVFTRWLENPDLVTLRAKAARGDSLSEEEEFLLRTLNNWTLWDWRFIHGEFRHGLLDESAIPIEGWRRLYRTEPGLADLWERTKSEFPEEFQQWMEERIVRD